MYCRCLPSTESMGSRRVWCIWHIAHCLSLCSLNVLHHKGIEVECSGKLFLAYDWWKAVTYGTRYIEPSEVVMCVITLGVTRLRLVTPMVYQIHQSFTEVYLLHFKQIRQEIDSLFVNSEYMEQDLTNPNSIVILIFAMCVCLHLFGLSKRKVIHNKYMYKGQDSTIFFSVLGLVNEIGFTSNDTAIVYQTIMSFTNLF